MGRPVPDLHNVAQEASRAPRVHDVRHSALEVRVALVEHRRAEHTQTVWHVGQLVAGAPARKPQAMNQLELVVPQQVQKESAGVENQVVAVVDIVYVDGQWRASG